MSFEYTLMRNRSKDPTVNTTVEILGGLHGLIINTFLVDRTNKPKGCWSTVSVRPAGFRRALSALRKKHGN